MNETYVTISGNVIATPTKRLTKHGVPFVTFRVASTARRMDSKTGGYVDAGTNFVNVTAFRGLAINVANSIDKGQPVIVYGRMRVNQWTNGEQKGTSVEVDAYNVGFDMARGTSTFTKVVRPSLHAVDDRLGDPAVQAAARQIDAELDRPEEPDPWAQVTSAPVAEGPAPVLGGRASGPGGQDGELATEGADDQPAADSPDGAAYDEEDTEEPQLRAG